MIFSLSTSTSSIADFWNLDADARLDGHFELLSRDQLLEADGKSLSNLLREAYQV